MKTKPKQDEVVWWLDFYSDPFGETEISVVSGKIDDDLSYKFNLFRTHSEALKAKREIVKILRGGV